jgi:hypothetical protein
MLPPRVGQGSGPAYVIIVQVIEVFDVNLVFLGVFPSPMETLIPSSSMPHVTSVASPTMLVTLLWMLNHVVPESGHRLTSLVTT